MTNESNSNGANNVSIYCGPLQNAAGSTSPLPPGAGCIGPEKVYTFTPDVNGEVTVNVTGISSNEDFDAFVFLSCDHNNCLAVSTNPSGQSEVLKFNGEEGQQYIIVIDGYKGTIGNYDIEIVCPPAELCDFCPEFVPSYSYCAGFENLNTGNLIPQASLKFTLFNSASGNPQVGTSQAKSGTKSLKFNNTSNIDLNIFRTLTETKVARLEWSMFTPNGKSGEWGLQTNNSSIYPIIGRINNGIISIAREVTDGQFEEKASVPYPHNQWVKFTLIFQPFENEIELWMNGKFLYKETEFGSNQVSQLNYYPNTQNPSNTEFFIDDILYREADINLPCTLNIDPVCVNGKEYQ
ncbi:MAG: hypothetical protein WBO36_16655, partial [Saprospiraceae bacterium]